MSLPTHSHLYGAHGLTLRGFRATLFSLQDPNSHIVELVVSHSQMKKAADTVDEGSKRVRSNTENILRRLGLDVVDKRPDFVIKSTSEGERSVHELVHLGISVEDFWKAGYDDLELSREGMDAKQIDDARSALEARNASRGKKGVSGSKVSPAETSRTLSRNTPRRRRASTGLVLSASYKGEARAFTP